MERASDTGSTRPIYAGVPKKVALYLACKRTSFRLCRALGLFRLARRMTGDGLRILCYHGFSIEDESAFSPRTFITADTFERRLRFLARTGFTVLPLGRALEALDNGTLPPHAVVITIDDGFHSTHRLAWPLLRGLGMPATVYVTTYYALKGSPIFRLAVQYMFWRTSARSLDPAGLGIPGESPVPIATHDQKSSALLAVIRHGETRCDEAGRERLALLLGERLGIDYRAIIESRILSIMNQAEIAELARAGIDIELHTHRHNLPLERDGLRREIEENRAILERITGGRLEHFCYPSGFFRDDQLRWLAECGITSAVTGERGFNYPHTPRLRLRRFVDGEDVSFVEFEGDLMGFPELLRRMMAGLKRIVGGKG